MPDGRVAHQCCRAEVRGEIEPFHCLGERHQREIRICHGPLARVRDLLGALAVYRRSCDEMVSGAGVGALRLAVDRRWRGRRVAQGARRRQLHHHRAEHRRRKEQRAVAEAVEGHEPRRRARAAISSALRNGTSRSSRPCMTSAGAPTLRSSSDGRERRHRPVPDALQMALVDALGARAQAKPAAEIAGDVGKPVGAGEQHEALDRGGARHRRAALGDEQRDEAAERMRDDSVDRAVVLADAVACARAHSARLVRRPGLSPCAGKSKATTRSPERRSGSMNAVMNAASLVQPCTSTTVPRLARVGLEHVGLHLARGRRHALPAGMAQVEARALGQHVVVVRCGAATARACRRCGRPRSPASASAGRQAYGRRCT